MIAMEAVTGGKYPRGSEPLGGSTVTTESPSSRTSLFAAEGGGVLYNGVIDRMGLYGALLVPSVPSDSIFVFELCSFGFIIRHMFRWCQMMRPYSCSG